MTDRNATPPTACRRDDALDARLRSAWRREQFGHAVHGAGFAMGWLGGIALVTLAFDWLIDLPGLVRSAALVAMIGVAAWWGWRRGWRVIRRFRRRRVGLQVESRHPALNSLLVCYVDFTERPPQPGVSAQLQDHACRQAIAKSSTVDFGQIAPVDRRRRGALAIAITLAVFAVASLLWPQGMGVFALRLVNPLSTVWYPTDTQIVMISGDIPVPEGGKVVLAARTEGVQPTHGTLRVRSDGRRWTSLDLVADDQGRFEHTFREVFRGFEYEFRLGDARAPRHAVTVVRPPRIIDATVTITPPDYTGLAVEHRNSLTISAPEGATVRWQLQLDRPVTNAALMPQAGKPIEMTRRDNGTIVEAEMTVSASGSYHINWQGQAHHFDYEGPKHYLQVQLDREPHVRIDYPVDNEKATLAKTLTVAFTARDDHGISQAVLVYQRGEKTPVRTPLGQFDNPKVVEQAIEPRLAKLVEDLTEGDIITYHIEATDRYPRPGGPRWVASDTRRVQILSEAEYAAYIQRQRAALLSSLRPVYRQERLAADNVRLMQDSQP